MKVREYKGVTPKVVTAARPAEMEAKLEELGKDWEFVDLQFSESSQQYSALALLKRKASRERKSAEGPHGTHEE